MDRVILVLLACACAFACAHAPQVPTPRAQPKVVTLTFTTPTHYTDGTTIGQSKALAYNVWQGARGVPEKLLIGKITTNTTLHVTALGPGEVCWQLSTEVDGHEGPRTNDAACKNFDELEPDPPRVSETFTVTITDAA